MNYQLDASIAVFITGLLKMLGIPPRPEIAHEMDVSPDTIRNRIK
jgi:hypothetical protein